MIDSDSSTVHLDYLLLNGLRKVLDPYRRRQISLLRNNTHSKYRDHLAENVKQHLGFHYLSAKKNNVRE